MLSKKPLNGSRVLVIGVAYKPNINDLRESPALDIIHLLQEKGALVSYYDPFIPVLDEETIQLTSEKDLTAAVEKADCVAIITNHSVDALGLREGGSAIALVKSSFVVLGEPGVRTSARNRLAGTVLSCIEGAVNAEVESQLSGGRRLVATVTNESAKELGIREGVPMLALVKASHVILAVAV